jgi:hypothetical protein
MDESEDVLDMVSPSSDESSEIVHPCKELSDKRVELPDAMRAVERLLTEESK